MNKLKQGLTEFWHLLVALFLGFYKLATPQRDKALHWIGGVYIFLFADFFLSSLLSFLAVVIIAFLKDFVWDKLMKKGTFEWWDIAYTIFGGGTILFYKLVQYEISTYIF